MQKARVVQEPPLPLGNVGIGICATVVFADVDLDVAEPATHEIAPERHQPRLVAERHRREQQGPPTIVDICPGGYRHVRMHVDDVEVHSHLLEQRAIPAHRIPDAVRAHAACDQPNGRVHVAHRRSEGLIPPRVLVRITVPHLPKSPQFVPDIPETHVVRLRLSVARAKAAHDGGRVTVGILHPGRGLLWGSVACIHTY